MRPSSDECPRCGAPLPGLVPGESLRTCGYCHTTLEVEQKARIERLADPRLRMAYLGGGAALLVTLAFGSVSVISASAPKPVAPPPSNAQTTATPVVADPPLVAEPVERERLRALSGLVLLEREDKSDAFLVLVTPLDGGGNARWLSAREPANGRELWRRRLDVTDRAERILRIPFGDTLVVALPEELWGLDAATGESSWQRARTTAAVRACEKAPAFGLLGADGSFAAYSITTGSPVSLERARCPGVYSSQGDAPNFAFVAGESATRWLPNKAGFVVTRGLQPRHGSAQVVLGAEPNGTASVGVLTGRHWLWQANVANEAPERASFTTPPLAAVREACVVVAYGWKSSVMLTALDLESGERRWTTSLAANREARADAGASELAISRGGHVAYRAGSGEFWVLSLETGAIAWTLHEKH